jgi:hypothetical protein
LLWELQDITENCYGSYKILLRIVMGVTRYY